MTPKNSCDGSHRSSTSLITIGEYKSGSGDLLCPGYKFSVPDGQLSVGCYPFAMHMARSVPWMVVIVDADVYLRSHDCTQTSQGGTVSAVLPCPSCCTLHNHSTVMGIHHHALDGAAETTPYSFLAPSHAINSLRHKDELIENLCT